MLLLVLLWVANRWHGSLFIFAVALAARTRQSRRVSGRSS